MKKHEIGMLGLGFWQAWWITMMCSPILIPKNDFITPIANGGLIVLIGTTLGYVVVGWILRGRTQIEYAHTTQYAAGICSVMGSSFVMLTSDSGAMLLTFSGPEIMVSCFLVGVVAISLGNALLLYMWGSILSKLASGRVGRHLYMSYTVAFVIFGVLVMLPYPMGGILGCLLPLISLVLLNACKNEPQRTDVTRPLLSQRSNIIKALIYLFILSLIFGLSQGLSTVFGAGDPYFTYKALLAAGITLFGITLSWMVNPQPQEALALYKPIFPALICGLCALLFLDPFVRSVGSGLIIMAIYCLDMFIMLVSTDIAYRSNYSISGSFGVTIIIARTGTLCGSAGALFISTLQDWNGWMHAQLIVACIMVLVILACVFADKSFIEALYTSQSTPPVLPTRDEACESLAKSRGLTSREREVLVLLSRGRTVKYICDELTIAPGTVKHHISNLYRKLGVLDRQELLDLIENEQPHPAGE